jgi:hypothetical protein
MTEIGDENISTLNDLMIFLNGLAEMHILRKN